MNKLPFLFLIFFSKKQGIFLNSNMRIRTSKCAKSAVTCALAQPRLWPEWMGTKETESDRKCEGLARRKKEKKKKLQKDCTKEDRAGEKEQDITLKAEAFDKSYG